MKEVTHELDSFTHDLARGLARSVGLETYAVLSQLMRKICPVLIRESAKEVTR
jgi:hypothetical protein